MRFRFAWRTHFVSQPIQATLGKRIRPLSSFAETLKQLGPSRLGIIGAIIFALLMFFVFISVRVSTPHMKLLYKDLSTNDTSAVASKLEEHDINYQVSPDGSRIVVTETEVGRARMLLAEAGLPNGGSMGYEIFDKQSAFGTTNFVQNVNQVRALEGELARTISSLDVIRSARVHLVLPQRELFSREQKKASGSVFIEVFSGGRLEKQQIAAVQSLVASAVENLKPGDVSIIDSFGNLLARGGENATSLVSIKAEEMRRSYESQLTDKIEDQVSRIVGYGKVRATVTAEMNFDRISTNEELYDPEAQVVRSSQVTEESSSEKEASGDEVSVENNLPGIGDGGLNGDQSTAQSNRIEEVTNYEISKTVRSVVREVGEIKKLSVAILVDGQYDKNEAGEKVYEPRPEEQLAQIEALVKSAVGFDEGRGDTIEVVNMQFAAVEVTDEFEDQRFVLGFEKSQLISSAEFLIVGIMIILVVVLVLQPIVNRLLEADDVSVDEDLENELLAAPPTSPALEAPEETEDEDESMINLEGVEGKVKESSVKKISEIIENYPNETVAVIRSWMSNEE